MRIPTATYRFQFFSGFRLPDAVALIDYLQALGISDVYASPLYQARKGSAHGYDVANPERINPEVGSEEDFNAFTGVIRDKGMGLLLDIVPNHMAANEENPWWRDLLERGEHSPYADFFDVDWSAPGFTQKQILVPLLGGLFGNILEKGELKLKLENGTFSVHYWDRVFPCSIKTYPALLEINRDAFQESLGEEHPAVTRLKEITEQFRSLELDRKNGNGLSVEEESFQAKASLNQAYQDMPEIKSYLDDTLRRLNGQKGKPDSFDPLEKILDEQTYRLSYWKIADEQINYRRFFNISDLICVRMEREPVFDAVHRLVFQWIREGKVTGLRIDHIDGLFDPFGYLKRLQEQIALLHPESNPADRFYVVVEKILAANEDLPHDWPVSGATGYEFNTYLGGVFLDRDGLYALDDLYGWISGSTQKWEDLVYEKKKRVMDRLFAGDIQMLRNRLSELMKDDRYARDLSSYQLSRALAEVTACLPVYRNYVREHDVSPRDIFYIDYAIQEAKRRLPSLNTSALEFLRRLLLLRLPANLSPERRKVWQNFVLRWQQFTGPLMAKGLEDTSLYIYNRLVSLNDVGGEPDAANLSVNYFHQQNARRRDHWPNALNATSTHDTKRSEDVRARIHVLSEMTEEWTVRLKKWFDINFDLKKRIRGFPVPSGNEEYLLYQTMLGFWPVNTEVTPEMAQRLKDYMIKACREAKVFTSWTRPDEAYESALMHFIDQILTQPESEEFRRDFFEFLQIVAFYGMVNSISQVILKCASPGIPDLYQGAELWDLSLVDPDNRRPVDYSTRRQALESIRSRAGSEPLSLFQELIGEWPNGRIKMYATYQLLQLRKAHSDLFMWGDYTPLYPAGARHSHLCAFTRTRPNKTLLILVPRLISKFSAPGQLPLGELWGDTVVELPEGSPDRWRDLLTGETIDARIVEDKKHLPASELFRHSCWGIWLSEQPQEN